MQLITTTVVSTKHPAVCFALNNTPSRAAINTPQDARGFADTPDQTPFRDVYVLAERVQAPAACNLVSPQP